MKSLRAIESRCEGEAEREAGRKSSEAESTNDSNSVGFLVQFGVVYFLGQAEKLAME